MSVAQYSRILNDSAHTHGPQIEPGAVETTKIAFEDITEVQDAALNAESDPNNNIYLTRQVRRVPANNDNQNQDPPRKFGEYSILLRRMVKEGMGGEWVPQGTFLEVQSKRLQDTFRHLFTPLLAGDVDLSSDPIRIPAPFKLLFYGRSLVTDFLASHNTTDSDILTQEMQLVGEFVRTNHDLRTVAKSYDNLYPQRLVAFDILWTIYVPGQIVVMNGKGYQECYRVIKAERFVTVQNEVNVRISMIGVDFDGTRTGEVKRKHTVPEFKGNMEIDSLDLVPLELYSGTDLQDRLIKRGQLFAELVKGPAHREYSGIAWVPERPGAPLSVSFMVEGRVVIDYAAYVELHPRNAPILLPPPTTKKDGETGGNEANGDHPGTIQCPRGEGTRTVDTISIGNEHYLRFPARIASFALRQRRWGWLLVDNISLIEWKKDPFSNLEMEEEKKLLIKTLVIGHQPHTALDFDDIVVGKGKGLIFLLHGPPGMGKTLTAESISEHARRPLYHISSGELTTSVSTMEGRIQEIFSLGKKWGAIVLLDEADVLMSKRTVDSLDRNAVVSVFLRLMEYYQGILFLTTNLRDGVDEAIFDRIHVVIEFAPMTDTVRQTIWRNLIRANSAGATAANHSWRDEVYAILGRFDVNGRTIKNLLRTAACYARAEDKELSLKHLCTVMKVNLAEQKFAALLDELRSVTESMQDT